MDWKPCASKRGAGISKMIQYISRIARNYWNSKNKNENHWMRLVYPSVAQYIKKGEGKLTPDRFTELPPAYSI